MIDLKLLQNATVYYNVALTRVRSTIVVVKKQKYNILLVCFAALGIQHRMSMRHIVIYGLCGYMMRFHIISPMARFKKDSHEHNVRVLIFATTLSETCLILKNNLARYDQKCILVVT
jgi:hypothetical protein